VEALHGVHARPDRAGARREVRPVLTPPQRRGRASAICIIPSPCAILHIVGS
jgi:hypothetical protein